MDMVVRLTLPKAGAFGENTVSENEGPLGEKPNFGSKLGGIGWECYFWSFSECFKTRDLQKIIENGKNVLSYRGFFGWAFEEPTFHPKMWGLWVTAETISKNMGSLGDSSAENRRSLEPYIHVTSIIGVPPPPCKILFWSITFNMKISTGRVLLKRNTRPAIS